MPLAKLSFDQETSLVELTADVFSSFFFIFSNKNGCRLPLDMEGALLRQSLPTLVPVE